MNTYLRAHHIGRLIEGLRLIAPGAVFERFGAKFLDQYLTVPLTHRGLNVLGHPVGGTVDTVGEDGHCAAEYSTEKTYFDGTMAKPTADAEHARALNPNAIDIFLLSSQESPIGKITDFQTTMQGHPDFDGRTLHVYDSRKIAEILVDHLLVSDTAVDQLSDQLPVLKAVRDEHAANLSIPELDYQRHVDRPDLLAEIGRRLTAHRSLAIWGLAGAGKSELAAAFAKQHRDQYELTLWLEGEDIRQVEDLRALPLLRGGESRNVATLLATRRCLLILDDVKEPLSTVALAQICRDGAHVIVTRRDEDTSGLEIPMMPEDEAIELLNRGTKGRCPPAIWNVIWAAIGGHPLSLGLMRAAVIEGATWADVAADCSVAGELEDGRQKLADRLLERLRPILNRELSLFMWAGQAACDRGFLRAVLQPVGLRKLERHGLTAADQLTSLRLHDVVFASLRAAGTPDAMRLATFDDALESYILAASTQPGLSLISVSASLKPKLEALVRAGNRRPSYIYALVAAWNPAEFDPVLVGDPMDAATALQGRQGADVRIEISVILEIIEGLYRSEKISLGMDGARAALKIRLPIFDVLIGLDGLADRQVAELQHHKGKALNILRHTAEATELFTRVLAGPCPLHETRLQLLRIYARKDETASQAAALAGEIIEAAACSEAVSRSVLLAVVVALPWGAKGGWRDTLLAQHADTIEHAILEAASAGLEQGYQAFSAVGRHWVWHDQERFRRIWDVLPAKSPSNAASDSECFNYGEILQQAAKTFPERADEFQEGALTFFSAIAKPDPFQRQKLGQLLVEMGRCQDAKTKLEAIPDLGAKPFALYWLSKAKLGISDAAGALADIDTALDKLGEKNRSYISSFRAHRYDVRKCLGDPAATEDLKTAIASCLDPKFKRTLQQRLAEAPIAPLPS